jgi:pimeloyl-ACP methyl ester carboxylesterase
VTEPQTDQQPTTPHGRSRGLWRWTKRILVGLAGLVVFVLLAGVVYQFVATKIDEYRYPAPGEMVDVGGYSLHLYCTGEGGGAAPTVVMDSGAGGSVLDWQLVQPEVAGFARVCTYDRGGAGWSEPGDKPRTSEQFVEELHTLLGNAGAQGPYVLVGHSLGGTNMQLYASQYPDEVAGMVLVDSALEDLDLLSITESLQGSPVWIKIYATIGVVRLANMVGPVGYPFSELPPDSVDEALAIISSTRQLYESADEVSSIGESFEQQLAAPMFLGDKSLIVLTAGPLQLEGMGLSQEQMDQMDEAHTRSQAALTQGSRNSEQIIAEDSGHYIQMEQPDLVIGAIRQVVDAARDGSSL